MNFIPPQDETRLRAAASGVLPNGKPVVVNADGTVSAVATGSPNLGSPVVFESANITTSRTATSYDSNSNKIVVSYSDGFPNGPGMSAVGTVSGDSISFGTPVEFNEVEAKQVASTFDSSNNKIVVAYQDGDNSNKGKAIIGTVSGTSISFGSEVTFNDANTTEINAVFDSTNNKVVIVFRDDGSSDRGTAIVGTVSGTSISFGSEAVFETGATSSVSVGFDSAAGKVVISYSDGGDGNKGKAVVGTVSGTSISFGSIVVFESQNNAADTSTTFDSNSNKIVIAYRDGGNSNFGTAIVGTVSGTDISFGTAVVFESALSRDISATFGGSNNKTVISYRDGGDSSKGKVVIGTVSGTGISFDSATEFESGATEKISSAFDNNSNLVIAYADLGNSNYGTAIVYQTAPLNLTAENYIGMSGGAVSFTGSAASTGSATTFELGKTDTTDIAYIGSNKVVIAYRQHYNTSGSQTQDGYCIVGTISGTSISFGTATAFSTGNVNYVHVANVENDKVVVFFQEGDNSNYATARVGTVSGTGISFGTAVVANSGSSAFTNVAGIGSNKVVGVYRDDGNSDYGTAIVGTVSGTDISFGSEVVFNSGNTPDPVPVSIGSSKVVIAYRDTSNSNYGKAIVGTVSGTSISFGSAVVFEAATIGFGDTGIAYIGSDKVVISYQDEGNSDNGTAIVGTVSGTSISFGTAAVFEAATTSITNSTSIGGDKVVIVYSQGSDAGQGNGKYAVGTVSGTGISFDTAVTFNAAPSWNMAVASPEDDKVAISWGQHYDTSGSRLGQALITTIDSRVTNRGQVASGSSASVDIIGTVNEQQTGLTAGQQYFVQTDGTIALTAGSPSVFAGTAISATKLLVKT